MSGIDRKALETMPALINCGRAPAIVTIFNVSEPCSPSIVALPKQRKLPNHLHRLSRGARFQIENQRVVLVFSRHWPIVSLTLVTLAPSEDWSSPFRVMGHF